LLPNGMSLDPGDLVSILLLLVASLRKDDACNPSWQHIYYPELADKYAAAFGATALTEQLIKHDMDEDAVESIFAPLLEAKLEKEVRRPPQMNEPCTGRVIDCSLIFHSCMPITPNGVGGRPRGERTTCN
jgi:hypothetical protein